MTKTLRKGYHTELSYFHRQATLASLMGNAVSNWAQIQELRKDLYIRWAEILEGRGIDTAKEGFTELVQ